MSQKRDHIPENPLIIENTQIWRNARQKMREQGSEAAPLQLKEPDMFYAKMSRGVSITPNIEANLDGAMRQGS